jgi:hypothetical protein
MSRLTRLEDAHRAMAAQHTALLEICRALLPLIPAPPEIVQQALVEVYDRSNRHMDRAAMDEEFQKAIRKWLDVLSAEVAHKHQPYPCMASALQHERTTCHSTSGRSCSHRTSPSVKRSIDGQCSAGT